MGDEHQPDPTRAIDDLDEVMIAPDPSRASTPDAWIGRVLEDRYRVTSVLGEGGFGVVLRAKHLTLGRDVAIKILQTPDGADPMARARFDRESSMLAALAHPHIVAVSDFGMSDGTPFLVMELVEGESLRAMMDRGAITPERALRIILQILKALAYAHERGIVHRDLKPANVLVQDLAGEDHAKLLDFGFARMFGEGGDKPGNQLTAHGTAFGTAGYIAPEQLGAGPFDGRTDLYPAAVMIYEMIAGERPFKAASPEPADELRAQLLGKAPALSSLRPDLALATALDPIVLRGIATAPKDRFASANEMARAIEELLPRASSAPTAPPPSVAPPVPAPVTARAFPPIPRGAVLPVAGVVGLALMIGLGFALTGTDDPPPPLAKPRPEIETPVELGPVLLGPSVGDRPAPRDPWVEPIPEELASIRESLLSGAPLEARERRALSRRSREQPWDPRPHLLIAYADRRERSLTNSIQEYERAYRASPESRGDVHMLSDLVVMAAHPTAGERAGEAIEAIYASEALPALERAIEASVVDARVHARLASLHARLLSE
jgi:eukaryotic-like serine/threonine-protein kinase